MAGISGSLHCTVMCGGLATYTSKNNSEVFKYQIGRLVSYLFLGLIGALFGKLIHLEKNNPKFILIPGLVIGLLFLYWGIETFRGKRAEIPMPKFFSKIYYRVFGKVVNQKSNSLKSFFTGLISIFLPCGVLYSVVLSVATFDSKGWAILSMFFFWLGTLPSMMLAPNLMRQLLNPMKNKVPKIYASILILIGTATIIYRVDRFQITMKEQKLNPTKEVDCH